MEEEDSQGSLTLWFHENKDKDGRPSNKVYGVTNCHVLRKNTTVDYEHRGGAPKDYVRVCGMRRFKRGVDEITQAIADHGVLADLWTREIVKLQEKGCRTRRTRERYGGLVANWTTRTKLSPISRPSMIKS
jgi:hypothetical protein